MADKPINQNTGASKPVRIDKWLWAARFYKTRSLAKIAVENGKVQINGQRVKPCKDITLGLCLSIRQGFDEREIIVSGLSEQRRGAPEAMLLYQETAASQLKREQTSIQRKLIYALEPSQEGKPNKKQRRQIHRFQGTILD